MSESIGEQFMRQTQQRLQAPPAHRKGEPQPPLQLPYDPSAELIDLPAASEIDLARCDLRTAIDTRRSIREYAPTPLTLEELSYLLWCTQGVKELRSQSATLRTVPSAGARHAFETYLLVNRVAGLEPGLYRFLAIEHKLIAFESAPDVTMELAHGCFAQDFVAASAATFIWTAVTYRMTWRYGQRGYRFLHLDAGHVCQNLYLAAGSIACGACAIAAFDDDALNGLLRLDGREQFVIYLATVGKTPST